MNVRAARLTTTVLGAVCAFLVLTALLQYAGVGRGYRWAPDDPASAPPLPGSAVDEKPLKFPPANAFASVEAQPLFNEDRKPTPIDASGEGGADASDAPQNPLNITLTGIVSTSSVKIAMVQDKARNQSVALKVGMPLEGDQASWTLVEVKPRLVVFRNAANESAEVELETALKPSAAGAPGGAGRGGKPSAPARPGAAAPKKAADASSDLARRIEERRKQMREDAERLRNGAKPAK